MDSPDAQRQLARRRNWTDRFRDGTGSGIGEPAAYNVELSFTLEDEPDNARRRRLVLISEALKAITNSDGRLVAWKLLEPGDDGWVHIQLVMTTTWPGEAAALSEEWMAAAIAAANLAADSPAATVPAPRDRATAGRPRKSLATLTAQVLSDPVG